MSHIPNYLRPSAMDAPQVVDTGGSLEPVPPTTDKPAYYKGVNDFQNEHARVPQYGGENGFHNGYAGNHEKEVGYKTPNRSKRRLWIAIGILLLLVVAAAIGGGVGGSMAVKSAKANTAAAAASSSSVSDTSTSTARATPTSTPPSNQTLKTDGTFYTPLPPSKVALIDNTCGLTTLISSSGDRFSCSEGMEFNAHNLACITAYTFQDCIDACSQMNEVAETAKDSNRCSTVVLKSQMAYLSGFGSGNCWLKGDDPRSTLTKMENSTVAMIIPK